MKFCQTPLLIRQGSLSFCRVADDKMGGRVGAGCQNFFLFRLGRSFARNRGKKQF